MKNLILLTLIACGASLALCQGAHAQDASPSPATTGTDSGGGGHHWGGQRGNPTAMLEHLTAALDLTADEQTQIKPILATESDAIQAVRANTALAPADRMAQIKAARDTANTAINAILTSDQQAKFTALQAKMHNHRHGGGQGGGDAAASPSVSGS